MVDGKSIGTGACMRYMVAVIRARHRETTVEDIVKYHRRLLRIICPPHTMRHLLFPQG